jgi:hypothetical protein
MIRITQDETKNLTRLDNNDPFVCQRATHYTLAPDPIDPKWDVVTYYYDFNTLYSYISKTIDSTRMRVDYKNPFKS